MLRFKQFITEVKAKTPRDNEVGQNPGDLELVNISLEVARKFAEAEFNKSKATKSLDEELPEFDKNFAFAKRAATKGRTKRKDMPVINARNVRELQARLKNGNFDIRKPFAKDGTGKNPFPTGLSKATGKRFLIKGLKKFDGDSKDDKIDVKLDKVTVSKLKPIQKQIFFDKAIVSTAKFGPKASAKILSGDALFFIVSSDNFIIDGHHRYLASILIDPKMKVNALVIDLNIKELLPLSLSFSDAKGNPRNK